MKRTSLLAIAAVLGAALLPGVASGQLAKERTAPANQAEAPRWAVFAGWGYTSLNQVNQSRYGLQGVNISLTRNFGRFFGVTADGAFYSSPLKTGSGGGDNPGDPSVDTVLAGPELHGVLYERLNVLLRGMIGGQHTGGESMKPDISFAGGIGGGMEYKVSQRIWVRVVGDNIVSSFVSDPQHKGYSPHMRSNGRAAIGLVYKF